MKIFINTVEYSTLGVRIGNPTASIILYGSKSNSELDIKYSK